MVYSVKSFLNIYIYSHYILVSSISLLISLTTSIAAAYVSEFSWKPNCFFFYITVNFSTYSILRLNVNRQMFRSGRLKIRCVSRIFNVYHRSFEKSVELEKKRHRRPEENEEHAYALKLATTHSTALDFDDNFVKYEALPAEVHKGDMTRKYLVNIVYLFD